MSGGKLNRSQDSILLTLTLLRFITVMEQLVHLVIGNLTCSVQTEASIPGINHLEQSRNIGSIGILTLAEKISVSPSLARVCDVIYLMTQVTHKEEVLRLA